MWLRKLRQSYWRRRAGNSELQDVRFAGVEEVCLEKASKAHRFLQYYGSATMQCPSLEHLYAEKCPLFSTSASSDFHSRNQVQLNDETHWIYLRTRDVAVFILHLCFAFRFYFFFKFHFQTSLGRAAAHWSRPIAS